MLDQVLITLWIIWLVVGVGVAFFLAWNNGSNNAANAIGTAVGAHIISLRKALVIAALFDFLGAVLFGSFVSRTLMKGIVDVTQIEDPKVIIAGMIGALLATGLWVLGASILKIPMSISQGIVGGVIGFGLAALGIRSIDWGLVSTIFISWAILPLASALIAMALYLLYSRMFRKERLMIHIGWSSVFLLVFSTVFLLMVKTLKLSDIRFAIMISGILGIVAILLFLAYVLVSQSASSVGRRNRIIYLLMVVAMASMSFSHGANDVANSAGPLTAIYLALKEGIVPSSVNVDLVMLMICAAGISIGILSWGSRVVGTIGEEITTLTFASAFTAQLAASLTVLILTRLGMPVSTTMSIVGAVSGVGLARGIRAVNVRTLLKIFGAWAIAVPVVAAGAAGIYTLLIMFI